MGKGAMAPENQLRDQLVEFLDGGFAPTLILLKEFDYKKAAIVLDGLHFSAWVLLGHMRARQRALLGFMQSPARSPEGWGDAEWPENHQPASEEEWVAAIDGFAGELEEAKALVRNCETDLFAVHPNGKSLSWAVLAIFHHNAYHIGQLKTIGRQLGVW